LGQTVDCLGPALWRSGCPDLAAYGLTAHRPASINTLTCSAMVLATGLCWWIRHCRTAKTLVRRRMKPANRRCGPARKCHAGTGGCRDRHLLGGWWWSFPAGCWHSRAVFGRLLTNRCDNDWRHDSSPTSTPYLHPWAASWLLAWLEGTRLASGCCSGPQRWLTRLRQLVRQGLGTQAFGAAAWCCSD